MLNTVLQYIHDKKNWRSGRWTSERTSALYGVQQLSAYIGREVVLASEVISFHPEDVALINSVSHIQWKFLEKLHLWHRLINK
jgi:hypothetical protein